MDSEGQGCTLSNAAATGPMMTTRLSGRLLLCFFALLPLTGSAQTTVNQTQQLSFAGLRSSAMHGQINGVASDATGHLYLLLDQKDGVRVLETDATGSTVLNQAQLGAAGDVGVALALDPSGQVFVTGTTTSTALQATSGAAIPQRTDASTNSFVAGFDSSLTVRFVTFTGGSKIVVSAVAATADAVFVTGQLYSATLPVTSNGLQQTPASGSSGNGFVERFSSDGTTLVYATYLTGASGDTTPTAIAADPSDDAYIAGSTSATGFPTVGALVPAILSNPSGFLTKLTPAGDGLFFSTFIPGTGLTSLALDANGTTLLASGTIAPGQFPVDTVVEPLLPTATQILLKLPLDGSSVQSSIALAPGTQSHVAAAPGSITWIDGLMALPQLPGTPLAGLGSGFALRVTSSNTIDQTARFGGLPTSNPSFASLPARITSLTVDPGGEAVIAGAILPTASASLLATETYDLPLTSAPTSAFPSSLRDAEQTAATCSGSLCAGSAAYLARLNPAGTTASLALSVDDAPFLTLRNLSSTEATGLTLVSSAGSLAGTCGSTLTAGGECHVLLTGNAASTLTLSAANAATQQRSVPASAAQTSTILFAPRELDFGIVSAAGSPGSLTITITNPGSATQTFASKLDASSSTGSPFTELSSDCISSGSVTLKTLASGATCHIQIGLTASSSASANGIVSADWLIGTRDVLLTGYTQAGAYTLSAKELDFGTEFANGLRLPRYLYLSNPTTSPLAHAAATLPQGSPFSVTDACPATLAPGSVCRLRFDYLSPTTPSQDTATVTLDAGNSVLLTGQMMPARAGSGSTVNPSLSVTPTSITFANAVTVTGVSSSTQNVSITNTGASPFTLTLALSGDFTDVTSCGATLAGGQTCAVALSFAPSQSGPRTGILAVTAGAGTSPAYVSLGGTGLAILPANSGSFDFGSVFIGQPRVQFYKIAQPFSSLSVATTGPYTVALVEDIGYGYGHPSASAFTASLKSACSNCYLAVQFLPQAAGPQTGTLALSSTAGGSTYMLSLTGQGLPTTGLLLTPLAQDFGTVPVNSTSGTALFTVTNLVSAGTAVTLNAPATTGDFTLTSDATGGQPCTGSLAYTASCLIAITFTPAATGSRTGALTIQSSGGSASATLTGFASADPGLAIRPLALTFSNVPGSSETQQMVTLTNTGSSVLQIGSVSTGTASFHATAACGALAPGTNCSITVSYTASSATVADLLTIPVTSLAVGGNPQQASYTVALAGAYTSVNAGLQIVPGQVAFGPFATSTLGGSRQFLLNNLTGKTLAVNLTVPRNFVLTGAPCTSLAANAGCTAEIEFAPLTAGDQTGTLLAQGIPNDGSAALTGIGYLAGYGTGQGTLKLSGVQGGNLILFGQVTSGQSAAKVLTLTNGGTAPVTVRRVTSAPPFLTTTSCGSTLAASQSCSVTIHYAPTNQVANGTASPPSTTDTGLLTIESDAQSSPDLVNLSGNGGPVAVAGPSNATPIALYSLSQTSLTFSSITVGDSSAAQTVTITNTGNATLQVLSATSTPDFTVSSQCGTLLAGTSCSLSVTSTPQTPGTHLSAVAIATDSSTSLEFVSLLSTSTDSALTVSPASLAFPSVQVGASVAMPVQVTNSGSSPVTFTAISTTGDYASAGNCPAPGGTLAGGASCTIQVTFKPSATGARSGVLSVATSATTSPLTVSLSGTGIQSQLLVTPASLAFGSVALGAAANLPLNLVNSGSAPVTGLSLSTTGDYAVTVPCASTTLAPGAACTAQVTFTPSVAGARSGTLTVTSSDPSSPLGISLSGTGVQAGSFTLTVNGGASAGATVQTASAASFGLTVTPSGGFTGTVALTCAAITAGPYMTCSLQPSTLALSGSAANATVTLNTVTTMAQLETHGRSDLWLCLLIPATLLGRWRRLKLPRLLGTLASFTALWIVFLVAGCGSSESGTSSNVHFTPPGTYQYQVTASSTNGTVLARSVTLNVTVQ